MLYQTYIPQPPLSDFVSQIWLYEGYSTTHQLERILPDGSLELVINLQENNIRVYDQDNPAQFQSFSGSVVVGPQTEYFVIDTACQQATMGVHFKAGGAFPFLGVPAGELNGIHLSLAMLWGEVATVLREQLLETETALARCQLLEQVLLAQATRPLARHPAVKFALQEFHKKSPCRTITNVTEQIGLSQRRFIELFTQEVGLSPKRFLRVRRFQEALAWIRSNQPIEWADLALGCGYFDQAHFNHDFRAFSGLNPTVYLAQQCEHLNHVPLPD
jgi:AraC-like DNA-binding protein